MAITTVIANPGFESGNTGWDIGPGVTIGTSVPGLSVGARTGSYYCGIHSSTTDSDNSIWNENRAAVIPGQAITARCWGGGSGRDGNVINVQLQWLDENENEITVSVGEQTPWSSPGGWFESKVSAAAPANAAYVRIGAYLRVRENGGVWVDDFSWSYVNNRTIDLVTPLNNATYVEGSNVKLSVVITGTSPQILKVEYLDGATVLASTSTPNYSYNVNDLALGTHAIKAILYTVDGVQVETAVRNIEIVPYVPPPQKREFKASNSYAYLVTSGFYGLTAGMPPTALVTGVEIELDYKLKLLVRSKDIDTEDPLASNSNIIFDITSGGNVETVLLSKDSTTYSKVGSSVTASVPIDLIDFTQTETGFISDAKKWTVFESDSQHATIGSSTALYGQAPIPAADFVNNAIGLRFYPSLNAIPDYADTGDACVRFMINQMRVRVYFDAGSVEYYFVSPSGDNITKGSLVNSYVYDGDFKTGDATGVLELQPELEVIAGSTDLIGKDWYIHSGNPPTEANKIGSVVESEDNAGLGFAYNGLPTYTDVFNNRSRYEIITNNFYGDPNLDGMYGVNGTSRAFTYNKQFFHYIFTQPNVELDKPRHVSNHHSHLALGYQEGRVDISVVGEPYNFSGENGASSWAIGDPVVGLLPLSGTLLGIFCKKSIWGVSGTTVDNFATQIISPKLGAIEYTITDMGFPVYANSYGIYTLSQTSQYGDFAGTPLSQAVSPWLRPRLVRSSDSNKEVVVAWPVRSKNQYKLAFADGYVLTMTMNYGNQSAPTFSKQKYFISGGPYGGEGPEAPEAYDLDRPALVPAAVSSELDDSGQERIHVANKFVPPPPPPPSPPKVVLITDHASYKIDFANDTYQSLAHDLDRYNTYAFRANNGKTYMLKTGFYTYSAPYPLYIYESEDNGFTFNQIQTVDLWAALGANKFLAASWQSPYDPIRYFPSNNSVYFFLRQGPSSAVLWLVRLDMTTMTVSLVSDMGTFGLEEGGWVVDNNHLIMPGSWARPIKAPTDPGYPADVGYGLGYVNAAGAFSAVRITATTAQGRVEPVKVLAVAPDGQGNLIMVYCFRVYSEYPFVANEDGSAKIVTVPISSLSGTVHVAGANLNINSMNYSPRVGRTDLKNVVMKYIGNGRVMIVQCGDGYGIANTTLDTVFHYDLVTNQQVFETTLGPDAGRMFMVRTADSPESDLMCHNETLWDGDIIASRDNFTTTWTFTGDLNDNGNGVSYYIEDNS